MAVFSPKVSGAGVEFDVIIQPKSSTNLVAGVHGDRLKIRITAPPVDGKANEALRKFLAKTFGISKSRVIIVSGETGRRKRIRIESTDAKPIVNVLEKLTG